ncbi:LexA family protein [Morganella morganii]|uniref:LexA family protein n=1 Tax=Morganella morganii TaxID=582 RepID=UPI000DCED03B|nr:LexA family transcriptional regulator [Morganella morganii]MBT0411880.1 LexA family transcriptional regulator [Morganella morganii subsp. morganii]MBV0430287.1 LexA family transcriptional regulator [Morganella morganii subsp. morganii]RAX25120.1 LexA family transcriptional repressor [Morganella morganii]HCT2375989.1 LexA family transcriptional regulator [Morganella morganii]
MEINERIRQKRRELGLTQQALADKAGVNRVTVTGWEKGDYQPNGVNLQQLAEALETDARWLTDGVMSTEANVRFSKLNSPRGEYPLISWVSAGNWCEALEPYHRKSIDKWYETTVHCSEDSFWLEVKGDSMTAPSGLSIPEGMVILVDPEIEPSSGKLVVAKIDTDNEATFKQYIVDAGNHYLKPLNPQYRMTAINGNCRIIGVVVDAKIARLP